MGAGDGTPGVIQPLVDNGPAAARWNLVLVADGFQADELQTFHDQCSAFADGLMKAAPFNAVDVASAVNVWTLDIASAESGIDDPVDCGGTGFTAATYLDTSFCDQGLDRLLKLDWQLAKDTVAAQLVDWDVIVVIANHEKWGGAGGEGAAAFTTAPNWVVGALHELGHAAFALADEYEFWQGCNSGETDHNVYVGPEPPEANVTADANPATLKWKSLVTPGTQVPTTINPNCSICDPSPSTYPPGTVGAFAGAAWFHCGLFRPEFNCRMRDHNFEFCAVCQERIRTVLFSFQGFTTTPKYLDPDVEPWPATLSWTTSNIASSWEVEVSPDGNFQLDVLAPSASQSGQVGSSTVWLKPSTTYYWRVRRTDIPNAAWSTATQFTTAAKKAVIISPVSRPRADLFYPWELPFSWGKVSGAGQYVIEVSEDDFQSTVFPPVYTVNTTEPLSIKVDSKQKWRVKPIAAEGGPDNEGEWSVAAVNTRMPEVATDHPLNNEAVPPWPVTIGWKLVGDDPAVMTADYYKIEMGYDEAHFGPESDKMLKELGVDPIVNHPQNTLSFNLVPRWLQENDQHFWRVRVFGPPPLSQEGKASQVISFVNRGDDTVPLKTFPWSAPPGSGLYPWIMPPSEGPAAFPFKHVDGAVSYEFSARRIDDNGHVQEIVWEEPVPSLPGVDEQAVQVDLATLGVGTGTLGYAWNIRAVGPEGIYGLEGDAHHAVIFPGKPALVSPANGAPSVPFEPFEGRYQFDHWYSPQGTYLVKVYWLSDQPIIETDSFMVNANPSGSHSGAGNHLMSGSKHSWRVRAHSTAGPTALYPWSDLASFYTAPKVKPIPAAPTALDGWSGSFGVLLCFFTAEEWAETYQFDVFQVQWDPLAGIPPDPDDVIASFGPYSFTNQQVVDYTLDVESKLSGYQLAAPPGDMRIVGFSGVSPFQAYKWHVRACNSSGCSTDSNWAMFYETLPWPW